MAPGRPASRLTPHAAQRRRAPRGSVTLHELGLAFLALAALFAFAYLVRGCA